MLYSIEKLENAAQQYCKSRDLNIRALLGKGMQGLVYYVSAYEAESALKIHSRQDGYRREVAVYQRLRERDVQKVQEFQVPRLISVDEELLAIEMSIVQPPFLLDYGGAYLDRLPSHVCLEIEQKEDFGDNWPRVELALAELEAVHKIFVSDINTGNIRFE